MNRIQIRENPDDALARHARKCAVCRHPDREAIEEEFLEWYDVANIAEDYDIADSRTIYRHARATGLLELRRQNLRTQLDNILEHHLTSVSADAVLRAIRAYSCLDAHGRWTDPPARVTFAVERPQVLESVAASSALPPPSLPAATESFAEGEPALLPPVSSNLDAGVQFSEAPTLDSGAAAPDLIAVSRLETPVSD